jgi:hypothetical protein
MKATVICCFCLFSDKLAGCQWLTPVILPTQQAEIRRITVQSQPGQIVCETLSQKRAGEVARGVRMSDYSTKKKKKKKSHKTNDFTTI